MFGSKDTIKLIDNELQNQRTFFGGYPKSQLSFIDHTPTIDVCFLYNHKRYDAILKSPDIFDKINTIEIDLQKKYFRYRTIQKLTRRKNFKYNDNIIHIILNILKHGLCALNVNGKTWTIFDYDFYIVYYKYTNIMSIQYGNIHQ